MRKMFIFYLIKVKKRLRLWALPSATFALALAVPFAASACAPPPDAERDGALKYVGHVSDVRARSLLELESLRVTDASGASALFRVEEGRRFDAFGPSHAREHMLTGEFVEVTYRESADGTLFILDLSDAPAEPPAPSE